MFLTWPDTPRGMATFLLEWFQLKMVVNQMRWPRFYLRQDIDDLFKFATRAGMKVHPSLTLMSELLGFFLSGFQKIRVIIKTLILTGLLCVKTKRFVKPILT